MAANEYMLKMIFGTAESLLSCQTYQFEDYAKVVSSLFDPEQRAQRRKEVFPEDCEKALQMGHLLQRVDFERLTIVNSVCSCNPHSGNAHKARILTGKSSLTRDGRTTIVENVDMFLVRL
jgi:hypothetical protein